MRREKASRRSFQCLVSLSPFHTSSLSLSIDIEYPGALDDDFGSGSEELESESEDEEGAGVKRRGELLSDDDDGDESGDDSGDETGSEDDDDDGSGEEASSSSDDEGTHANDASFAALERKSAKLDAQRARDAEAAAEEAREQGLPTGADEERVSFLPVISEEGEEGEGQQHHQPDEPRVLRRRIAEVARVLENFSKLAEKGRSRSDYMERVSVSVFFIFFSLSPQFFVPLSFSHLDGTDAPPPP